MIRSAAHAILQRELAAVRRTVEAYSDDASLWAEREALPNSGGTLVLHIAGNLQHFIGAIVGETGYVRDRDAEFARRGVSRAELLAEIDAAAAAVDAGFEKLPESDEALMRPYALQIGGREVAVGDFLVHLASHLAYHLGQLDYHRRLVTGVKQGVGAMSLAELPIR